MRTINQILLAAFGEIQENHRVALVTVEFDTLETSMHERQERQPVRVDFQGIALNGRPRDD